MTDPSYIPRLYGRRQDRPLRARQAHLMQCVLPELALEFEAGRAIDVAALADGRPIWLEIGFGGGEHLAQQAARRPDVLAIGVEPFVNGVAKLLLTIDHEALGNIRIHHGDARPLLEALPVACLDRLFVLHPDPWPKKRHFKRRMISPWFFQEAARIMKPGAVLRVASDIPDYVRWTLMHAQQAPAFEWLARRAVDWRHRPEDWPQTRYEAKALKEGRQPAYLEFRRQAGSHRRVLT